MQFTVRKLTPHDLRLMEAMMTVFGEVFDELDIYTKTRPSRSYTEQLLGNTNFIALAALRHETAVGGLAAYELQKFERERSEIYIYDLAVAAAHRRQGIASLLIAELHKIAAARGAYVMFVHADLGDDPAIALYSKPGTREDVLQFEIKVSEHGTHYENSKTIEKAMLAQPANDYRPHGHLQQQRYSMEMAYRERWQAEITALQRILSGFDLIEECKWGKPCYTMDGKNVVIIQGFKEYCALGFVQGAALKDPKKLLVQLGQVQAARVMKFTSTREIATKAATIKAYVGEAVAAEKAGIRPEAKPEDFPVPEELKEKFRSDPRFRRAFEALTPGRQRGYLFHFARAKQSSTRIARIEKAMPAIFAGRGFLERR